MTARKKLSLSPGVLVFTDQANDDPGEKSL